ncbi:MAG: dimethyl sulfoxide reductase anchor subunit family protein [Geminicoccaceae bacterium]
MHPAYSVILFTTASGAGYGLLIWLGLAVAFGGVPGSRVFGLVGLGIALLLITGGLLASTAHLGHPERAWRAMSQWRSSWLSREGVLAIATYLPAGLLAIAWVLLARIDGAVILLALFSAILAAATVYCTAMIYASLRTIPAWSQPLTVPNYLLLALASGGLLFNLILSMFRTLPLWSVCLALMAIAAALLLKHAYWQAVDKHMPIYTTEAATGLGRFGKVRPLEPAHSQPNFVMREMGYSVGRKHADRLRLASVCLGFLVPIVCLILVLALMASGTVVLMSIGTLSMAIGIILERWLFFAEAEHVAMIYYGRDAA